MSEKLKVRLRHWACCADNDICWVIFISDSKAWQATLLSK